MSTAVVCTSRPINGVGLRQAGYRRGSGPFCRESVCPSVRVIRFWLIGGLQPTTIVNVYSALPMMLVTGSMSQLAPVNDKPLSRLRAACSSPQLMTMCPDRAMSPALLLTTKQHPLAVYLSIFTPCGAVRWLNQDSFVSAVELLFVFFDLYCVYVCISVTVFFLIVCLTVTVKWLAVTTASEMTILCRVGRKTEKLYSIQSNAWQSLFNLHPVTVCSLSVWLPVGVAIVKPAACTRTLLQQTHPFYCLLDLGGIMFNCITKL